MRLLRRIGAALAVSLLVFGLDEGCAPNAAHAAAVHGCGTGYICMWDYNNGWNGSGPVRKITGGYVDNQTNDCLQLAYLNYDPPNQGQAINNTMGALIVNQASAWSDDLFVFYDWGGCNSSNGAFAVQAINQTVIGVLQSSPYGDYNNRLGSIGYCSGCLPSGAATTYKGLPILK